MKKFKIKDNVFKTEVMFVINCDHVQFERIAKKFGAKIQNDEYGEDTIGTVLRSKDGFRIVWLRHMSKRTEDIACLVHEVVHLVVRILEHKGVPVKANIETGDCGDETHAYLMEFYVSEVLKRI